MKNFRNEHNKEQWRPKNHNILQNTHLMIHYSGKQGDQLPPKMKMQLKEHKKILNQW